MDSQLTSVSKCWLCPESARSKAKWASVMDQKVAESICKLLWLDYNLFFEFFKSAEYCGSCQEFVLEIDFLIRTMCEIKAKILEARTLLSQAVLKNLDILAPPPPGETDDPLILNEDSVFQTQTEKTLSSTTLNSVEGPINHPAAETGSIDTNLSIKDELSESIEEMSSITPVQLKPSVPTPKNREYSAIPPESAEVSDNRTHTTRSCAKRAPRKQILLCREVLSPSDSDDTASNRDPYVKTSSSSELRIESLFSQKNLENIEIALPMTTDFDNIERVACENTVLIDKLRNRISNRLGGRRQTLNTEQGETASDEVPLILRSTRMRNTLQHGSTHSYREPRSGSESQSDNQSINDDDDPDFVADLSDLDVEPDGTEASLCVDHSVSGNDLSESVAQNSEVTSQDLGAELGPGVVPASQPTARVLRSTRRNARIVYDSESHCSSDDGDSSDADASNKARRNRRNRKKKHQQIATNSKSVHLTEEQCRPKEDGKIHCFHGNCTKSYTHLTYLREHIYLTHTKRPPEEDTLMNRFSCQESGCTFSTRSRLVLEVHGYKDHENDPLPYKCDPCKKAFKKHYSLIVHKQKHHGSKKSDLRPRGGSRRHLDRTNESGTTADAAGLIPGSNAEIAPVNPELALELRALLLRKSQKVAKSDSTTSEAQLLRTSRKRKLRRRESVEASEEGDEYVADARDSDGSNTNVRKVPTRRIPRKAAVKPMDRYLSITRNHLSLEIKTTYRDLRYHCFEKNCTTNYLHIYDMKKHISAEHPELIPENNPEPKIYRCRAVDCSVSTESAMELYNHFKEIHETNPIVKKRIELTEEQMQKKEDGRVHCFHDNCSKSYLDARELKTHIYKCHTERTPEEDAKLNRFPCRESGCSFFTRSNFVLQAHMYKVHQNDPLPYKCVPCKKNYSTHDQLILHNNAQHRSKELICHLCGKQHARKSGLDKHMRKSHKNEEGFKCSVCFQKFFFREDCDKHEAKHVPGGPPTCLVMRCHKIFENHEALRLHVVEAHYEALRVFCDQCGNSFKNRYGLTLHQKTHTDLFEFPCTDCDKKFRSKSLQRSHFETVHAVNGGQVYPCKLCEKTFHCRIYLHKHTAWHRHGVNANKPLRLQKKVLESSDEDS